LLLALGAAALPLAQACAPQQAATPTQPAQATQAPKPQPTSPPPTQAKPTAEAKPTAAAQPTTAAKPGAIAGQPPNRPVEFVISTAPGGGSDIYARYIIGVIEKLQLSPQTFLPVNKEGGAGAVAMQYLASKKGDPHAIMITLNSFITTPMLQKLPFTTQSFTPIALLALDSFFLWVPADSSFQSLDDFLNAAKEREITVGGTGSKQEDEILFTLIRMRAGTKPFKYVPFEGGGAVATALAGKQVEATVNNPSEAISFFPDKVRPLAAFLDERAPAFPDVPTAKELGLDITYANMRSIVAAPEISREQREWHIGLMKAVYDSTDWQDFVKKNALEARFLGGDDFGKFLSDFEALHKDIMTEAGWLQ
jgi:tripartite-type tricarboxylate transporter receptor subunit TctC